MITYKRWKLFKSELTEADMLWIKAHSVKIDCRTDTEDFSVVGSNESFRVAVRRDIIITTNCKSQEAMLKLKYEDNILLLLAMAIPPDTFYQDQFGVIP